MYASAPRFNASTAFSSGLGTERKDTSDHILSVPLVSVSSADPRALHLTLSHFRGQTLIRNQPARIRAERGTGRDCSRRQACRYDAAVCGAYSSKMESGW